jgi:hypothetical protein
MKGKKATFVVSECKRMAYGFAPEEDKARQCGKESRILLDGVRADGQDIYLKAVE